MSRVSFRRGRNWVLRGQIILPSHCASVTCGGRARRPSLHRIDSSRGKRDPRMEKRACDPGGDCYQLPSTLEYLPLRRPRHCRQTPGAATADEGGAFFIGGDAWQLRHQLSGMDEQRLSDSLLHRGFQRLQRVGIFDGELGDGGASQRGQMSAASQHPAHVVGHRPYVGARGHARAEGGLIGGRLQNLEFFDFYLHRLEDDLLLFAGPSVVIAASTVSWWAALYASRPSSASSGRRSN